MTDVSGVWIPPDAEDGVETAAQRFLKRCNQFMCSHKNLMPLLEPHRLSLQCPDCGWESPGIDVAPAAQFASLEPRR